MIESAHTSELIAMRIDKQIKLNERLFKLLSVVIFFASLALVSVVVYTVSTVY